MTWKDSLDKFKIVRNQTLDICKNLETEDYVVQAATEVSPPKWHLAHTSWFFENFVLNKYLEKYKCVNEKYNQIFNSYYKSQGDHWQQAERGQLSRPLVSEILEYRSIINEQIESFPFDNISLEDQAKLIDLVELGINHEQQHQELLLMDIKYILSAGPIKASLLDPSLRAEVITPKSIEFHIINGGLIDIGHKETHFCYDNERPAHKVYIEDFEVANRTVTNREYLSFIEAGAYENPELWKSDAWDHLSKTGDKSPLYWFKDNDQWFEYSLYGVEELKLDSPASHISFYEADAYSKWAGARLLTEFEWELAASSSKPQENNFLNLVSRKQNNPLSLHGNHWEWTSSSYLPYPKYKQEKGALGEYNGKFMNNQYVLRGGCLATPFSHYRISYRNFYRPNQKWMFSAIRLAKDIL